MSLVAYGSSDDSEDEKETYKERHGVNSTHNNLSSAPKKHRETVKITIPSLKEFKEEESDVVATQKPKLKTGGGLFNLLPPPKNSSPLCKPGFTPYILSKKKETGSKPNVKKNQKLCTTSILPSVSSAPEVSADDHDSDDNTHVEDASTTSSSNDYFFLNESNEANEDEKTVFSGRVYDYAVSSSSDNPVCNDTHSASIESLNQATSSTVNTEFLQPLTSSVECNNDASEIHSFMQDKEFLKLKGRRRELEEINIIDVNADDQLTDKNEWLMKSLTEEKDIRPHKRKNNMPTQQQKRKHQITYLAFQAKERELDLKNQWSLNSRTRRETQAKYGF